MEKRYTIKQEVLEVHQADRYSSLVQNPQEVHVLNSFPTSLSPPTKHTFENFLAGHRPHLHSNLHRHFSPSP